jgi:hypothetical protein
MAYSVENINSPDIVTCKVTGAPIEIRRMRDEAMRADCFCVCRKRWAVWIPVVPPPTSWIWSDPRGNAPTKRVEIPENEYRFLLDDSTLLLTRPGSVGSHIHSKIEEIVRRLERQASEILAEATNTGLKTPEQSFAEVGVSMQQAINPEKAEPTPKHEEPSRTIGYVKRRLAV